MPFYLAPWQTFVVGSLFGWMTEDGYRRFRLAYIETGKGSGKSPLVAGIGLYGLVSDGENRAEIYAAATKRDQAMILFRDAVSMVSMSPHMSSRVVQSGRDEKVWNLYYPNTKSFFKPISADEGQSGPRPHIGLLDELHEHKTATTVNMMRAGTKNRRKAMVVMITNSGSDKKTVCGQYHDLGVRICAGKEDDDSFLLSSVPWMKATIRSRMRAAGPRSTLRSTSLPRARRMGSRVASICASRCSQHVVYRPKSRWCAG